MQLSEEDYEQLVDKAVCPIGATTMSRIVCQFSCGAASAIATKLALAEVRQHARSLNIESALKQAKDGTLPTERRD